MRLIYVDESYCKVCYYVVALLVPDTEAQALTAALDTVVHQAAASYNCIRPTAELHGYDLFQGKGDWEPIKLMPRARIGAYDQALRAIADEPGQADQQPEYRADLRRYQDNDNLGHRRRRITRIVDTLHFATSSASRLVQAVDLIAFLYHRIKTTPETADARAVRANAALWQRIQPRVAHCYCWRP